MATDTRPNGVRGPAIDAPRERRPGVPMEEKPHHIGAAHWDMPERQQDPGYVLKREDLDELTPVFGTASPPRGISGMMRRAAYKIPEHHTTHWFMLLAADRVDAIEHGWRRWMIPAMLLGVAGPAVAFVVLRGRRRRRFFR